MEALILVLTVCTLAEPSICEERRLAVNMDGESLRGCASRAQPYIAQWAGDHPGVHVTRWRCVAQGGEKDKS
jgi:hypothetical protein